MVGGRRVRAIDRDDVHPGEHLVEALPIGGLKILGDPRADRRAVVVVDLHAEGAGPAGHRLADPAHADDPKPLSRQSAAHHPCRGPALELARLNRPGAFHDPAGDGHHQGEGQVGGILRQDAGRVGHGDSAGRRRRHVDVVHPCSEVGDQLEPISRLLQDTGVDPVGDGRGQNIAAPNRVDQGLPAHGRIRQVQLCVEQFPQARLDGVRQPAGHDHFRLGRRHQRRVLNFSVRRNHALAPSSLNL